MITHWHLVRSDWPISDQRRFANDTATTARRRPTHGIARTPDDAATWMVAEKRRIIAAAADPAAVAHQSGLATPDAWAGYQQARRAAAERGDDVHGVQALGAARVAHLSAYALTAAECRCDERRRPGRPTG